MTRRRRQAALLLLSVALFLLAAVIGAGEWVQSSVTGRVLSIEDAPMRESALVLGAPPGRLLEARMETACQLVAFRIVSSLVLSGMPNEMPIMRARARACLADENIVVDEGAERTLASFVRAKEKLGISRALVVSQAYHLPRAIYLADAVGFEAIGIIAEGEPSAFGRLRERLASVRALLDVRRLGSAR